MTKQDGLFDNEELALDDERSSTQRPTTQQDPVESDPKSEENTPKSTLDEQTEEVLEETPPDRVAVAMEGDMEEDGQLALARYASRAYLEYAMSVVKSRALPEVCDGQKPVQRRILIDMDRMGLKAGARAVKSARVVGDVLGKYHPHGDRSVYDAMVRMAQSFSLRYPLVDGQGNFGSRDGDSQAAMRYTEARLTPISSLLLEEVDKGAVDFVANYDGNFTEPTMLPAKLPFVLLNGASGIAVGMATEIPSHNLREVANACQCLLDKPESTLDELMAHLPGPDFPCGAQIISSRQDLKDIYRTGRGSIKVRARYHFEELSRGQWQLVIDELPPAASSQSVLSKIEEITNPKVKPGKKTLTAEQTQAKSAMLSILDRARDESGRQVAVRLVFEPKTSKIDRDEFVRALLISTDLESNVSVNLVMIGIDGRPQQKDICTILKEWLEFRQKTVRRRSQARLEKVLDRLHVLEGRTLALLNLDRVIEIIRHSDEPKVALMAEFALTERQTEDILEIRLRQLAKLEAIAIEREMAALKAEQAQLERILGSDRVLNRLVYKEITEAAKTFGDERRTLIEEAQKVSSEPMVVDEPVTVVISQKCFVRVRTGHGHDCAQMSFKMGDALDRALECRSVDTLYMISSTGRVYNIAISALPGARGDGLPLISFVDWEDGTEIAGFIAGCDNETLLLATSDGMGLLCQVSDLQTRLRSGKQFVRLEPKMKLLAPVHVAKENTFVACLSKKARLLIFDLSECRRLSSGGKGLSLINLEPGDSLLSVLVCAQSGFVVEGIGRGKKARQAMVKKQSFMDHQSKRNRKGKVLALTWTPLKLSLPEIGEPLEKEKNATGLTIEMLEEGSPRLL